MIPSPGPHRRRGPGQHVLSFSEPDLADRGDELCLGRQTEFTPRYLFSERERPNLVVRVRVRIDDAAAVHERVATALSDTFPTLPLHKVFPV